jgi:hypothetical protein
VKYAAAGLPLLVPNFLKTKENWDDEEPTLKEMRGIVEAMKSLRTGVLMGGRHRIGHQLGPLGVWPLRDILCHVTCCAVGRENSERGS